LAELLQRQKTAARILDVLNKYNSVIASALAFSRKLSVAGNNPEGRQNRKLLDRHAPAALAMTNLISVFLDHLQRARKMPSNGQMK